MLSQTVTSIGTVQVSQPLCARQGNTLNQVIISISPNYHFVGNKEKVLKNIVVHLVDVGQPGVVGPNIEFSLDQLVKQEIENARQKSNDEKYGEDSEKQAMREYLRDCLMRMHKSITNESADQEIDRYISHYIKHNS